MPYPTGQDLRDYVVSCGLILADPAQEDASETYIDYDTMQAAANADFEDLVSRTFIATEQTLYFNPGDFSKAGILMLYQDVVSVSSLTILGVSKSQGPTADYILGPKENAIQKRPYFQIRLNAPQYLYQLYPQQPNSVVVVAMCGYSTDVPANAFKAMLAQGAISIYPQLALMISGGLMLMNQKNTREEYSHYADQGPLSTERKAWEKTVATAQSYFGRTW